MQFVRDARQGLEELRRLDPAFESFGAKTHRYLLDPALNETSLAQIEQQWGFRAPEDYRSFLLELGNGGAGPGYGLFRLGEIDDGFEHKSWTSLDPKTPFPHCESWNDTDIIYKSAPDPGDFDDDASFERARDAWLDSDAYGQGQDAYWRALGTDRGCIPVCHHGCGLRDWLVVRGPEAGHVWHDLSADQLGIAPMKKPGRPRSTFADWYLDWIEATLTDLR